MKKILSLALVLIMLMSSLLIMSSCGKEDMKIGKQYNALTSQTDVLVQLNAGSIDVGVMDSIMAGYYMSQDSAYSDTLMIVEDLTLATEQYGIAARKGSGFAKKINEAIIALADTDYKTIATQYGLATETLVKADTVNPQAAATDDSWNKVVTAKKLVIGYTLFAPIAYNDGDGADAKLVGFDIDLAKAVVA